MIEYSELLKMLEDSEHVLIIQRKIVQLIIDAFIDLEEIEGAERESMDEIEKLISILDKELIWIKDVIFDDIL